MRAPSPLLILLLAFAAAAPLPPPARADAPFEAFHAVFSDALKPVLREAVGVLVIGPAGHDDPAKQTLAIPVLAKRGDAFAPDGTRTLFSEAIPLSSYGYGEPDRRAEVATRMGLAACRFPVTAWEGDHARIVLDPSAGTRAWISMKALAKEFSLKRIPVEKLPEHDSFATVDPFCFTLSGNRKVYEKPDRNAAARMVARNERRSAGKVFVAKEVRGEFLKIEVREGDGGNKPLDSFWVRLRDDSGMLMVWPVSADPC